MKNKLIQLIGIVLLSVSAFGGDDTLYTLIELKKSQEILINDIKSKNLLEKKSKVDEEKAQLKEDIKTLNKQLDNLQVKFEKIATGIDTSTIQINPIQENSDLMDDLQLLIKPLIYGAKEATVGMRKKAQLQEEANYYKIMLPKAVSAYENIKKVSENGKDSVIKKDIEELKNHWKQQVLLFSSHLNASLYQLDMLEKSDLSFGESLKQSSKTFFRERGRYLLEGLIAFLVVIAILEFIYLLFIKLFPSTVQSNRNFYIRFGGLLYKIIMSLFAIMAPMGVFYYEEDWVLFSIGLLLIFGIAWTFRHLMPKFWQQTRLLLNIGSVRENERIYYLDLPWRVQNINIFTILENPDSGVKLRLPIEDLVGLTSRPSSKYEPWFPCRINDWVILSNEYYGKVVGVSLEFIELVDIGGGHRTFLISDFLSLSPLNLSTDFRIINTLGISYRHQKESTNVILQTLEKFILEKIKEEDYTKGFKSLVVQFKEAGDSSLNITIIGSFSGEMAPLYFRLKRAINRWCVDACTQNNWEIPFPQLTIHQAIE